MVKVLFLGLVMALASASCGAGGAAPEVLGEPLPAEDPVSIQVSATGPQGGPFIGAGLSVQVQAAAAEAYKYQISSDRAWVKWDATASGEVAAGDSLGLTISFEAGSSPTTVGTHAALVTLTDQDTGLERATVHILLTITAAPSGWSEYTPSSDSRLVYVSSSEGDDTNSGLNEAAPKRTLVSGRNLMRDGFPDFLYLRRGDTWTDETLDEWEPGGRSASERMVLTSYGPSSIRPRIVNGRFGTKWGGAKGAIAIIGVHFQNGGLRILGHGDDILIEDCLVEGWQDNITIIGLGGQLRNVSLRRNVIIDAHPQHAGHSQGLYVQNVSGLLIKENLFDHNGWSETVTGAGATIFNHNVYVQSDCSGVVFEGNISANASSHGIQQRPGGLCKNNLFIGNPIGVLMTGTGSVEYNVLIDSRDIGTLPRAFGIWIEQANDITVGKNIIAHRTNGSQPIALRVATTSGRLLIQSNIVYDWARASSLSWAYFEDAGEGGTTELRDNEFQQTQSGRLLSYDPLYSALRFSCHANSYYSKEPEDQWFRLEKTPLDFASWQATVGETGATAAPLSYTDASRNVDSYWTSIGGSGGAAGFLAAARNQSRVNWNPALTAARLNAYIRSGFGMAEPTER